jgi:type VI secretion system protein ImpI
MSLLLAIERAPHPQAVAQMRLDHGALVIGRGAEADWRIDDPDMYVSRSHCTIEGGPQGYTVTDMSSGGLYLDHASAPLGRGNSAPLRDGMRLRLGDYVLRVEMAPPAGHASGHAPGHASEHAPGTAEQPGRARPGLGFDADDFFSAPIDAPPPEERPAALPPPFDRPPSSRDWAEAERAAPPLFDDPFTLDPQRTPPPEPPAGFGSFDWDAPPEPEPEPEPKPEPQRPSSATPSAQHPEPRPAPPSEPGPAPPRPEPRPEPPGPRATGDPAREAFLRGLGLAAGDWPEVDVVAEMEAFGRAHRLMLEGLMHLLRTRAEEKAGARIAQTIVAGSEVNPLKFTPSVDDALAVMIARRSPGFLDQEAAIAGAIRDLAQHHVSTWRGVQGALGRMLDRFDPAKLEEELERHSAIETLLAGGRRAKLWELYEQRYREIARNAETRFLGEISADFRDAYEQKGA